MHEPRPPRRNVPLIFGSNGQPLDPDHRRDFNRIAGREARAAVRDHERHNTHGSSGITVAEIDGAPDVDDVTRIEVTNAKLTDDGSGQVTLDLSGGGGGSLTVAEIDGAPDVPNVTRIEVTNAKLTDDGGGQVTLDLSGGGGAGDNPAWLDDTLLAEEYPTSPNSMDDEFEAGGVLDAKWTAVNNPSGGNAFDQTTYAGFLQVGLQENASNPIFYQAAPAGAAIAMYEAKVSVVMENFGANIGEWGSVYRALVDSVSGDMRAVGVEINDSTAVAPIHVLTFSAIGSSISGVRLDCTPGEWIYLRLWKSTANAYTASNTYRFAMSHNGIIWHQIAANNTFTFANDVDRVGFFYRSPKNQSGSPLVRVIVDYFRRTI